MSNTIDLQERRISAHPAKNLKEALDEAGGIASCVQGHMIGAQLSAIQDWDAEDDIDAAATAVRRLLIQLDFAKRLAQRRKRQIAAALRTPQDAA